MHIFGIHLGCLVMMFLLLALSLFHEAEINRAIEKHPERIHRRAELLLYTLRIFSALESLLKDSLLTSA